ncbi:MAG: sugar phosphate isomerase/epimerase [Planctomycetota bacterium]|nr:MAG: sugar phosphate isomerase/epimerase [Planctomycetota bacterium]
MSRHRDRLSRRRFIAGAAVGTAALWAGRHLAPAFAESKKWQMRLSCSSINFSSLPIEQAIERIAALGFDAIDIWSAHAGCPHLDDVLNRVGPEKLKELLDKAGLELYAFSVYVGGYAKYAELLGKAGGGVAVRGSSRPAEPGKLGETMKKFVESLKPDLELCEKYDSYLAIENHANALLHTMDSIRAFIDAAADYPRLGMALAPFHIQSYNGSVPEAIRIAGKKLFFFYAWQRGSGTQQLPGIGPVDCTPWLEALAEIDFGYPVNPFMHHEPEPDAMSQALRQSCDYLKACYRKVVG